MNLGPAEKALAADLERVSKRAFQKGMTADQFWSVLAGFVGFSMGNAPENDREALVHGVGEFGKAALTHALHRRKEIAGNESTN